MSEEGAAAEAVNEAVKDIDASDTLESLKEQEIKAMLDNNTEALKEINDKKIALSKNIIRGLIDTTFKGDALKTDKVNQIVQDAFDKIQSDPNNGVKIWSEAEAKISALDKSFGTKCLDTLKYPFEKMYDGYSSLCDYFTSDEGKVKKLALDKSRAVLNDPNATADQKIEAQKEYAKTMKEISPELDKSDKNGESKYGEKLWSLMKLLFIAGGVIGILAILAKALNGCYQYKIGKNRLKICDDFYHQDENHSYCACGSPANPLLCDDTTNNYPYCKCLEVKGQVCNMEANSTSQLYYSYDDSHSPWSVVGDVVVGAYNLGKDIVGDSGDIWTFMKKYGTIIIIVIGVLISLYIIKTMIEAYTETKHIVHDAISGESTEVTSPEQLIQIGRKMAQNQK